MQTEPFPSPMQQRFMRMERCIATQEAAPGAGINALSIYVALHGVVLLKI